MERGKRLPVCKWLNEKRLRKCAENGVFGRGAGRNGKKQCRFGGGVLRMWNVSFAWGAAEWGMCHAAQEYFSHRCHRSTQKPCRVLLSKNTDCTDAHGWVFSRILYSCSAAYRLVLMRRRRNGLPRIFSQAESCVGECHTMGLLGMRKICGNLRDLWATTKRTMR